MINMKITMKKYLIGGMLGLSVGAILYLIQPVEWKAQALVRIGQISQNQNTFSVEPLTVVIERLKSKSFSLAVGERAKINLLDGDKVAGLTVKPIRNSDSIIITVIGGSAELVKASIDGIVAELISRHDAILEVYQSDVRKELSRLDSEISVLAKRMATDVDGRVVASGKHANEIGLHTGFEMIQMQHELDYKLNRSSLLRQSISSAYLRPTSLIEAPSISEQHILSKLWQACLFGTLVGIFLSMLWVRLKK